jgi:hypothetical protein
MRVCMSRRRPTDQANRSPLHAQYTLQRVAQKGTPSMPDPLRLLSLIPKEQRRHTKYTRVLSSQVQTEKPNFHVMHTTKSSILLPVFRPVHAV